MITYTRLTHAVVSLPALDMRPEPRHAAELISQLLMGETVTLLDHSSDRGWIRVRNDADGYSGWVRAWGLVAASRARVARWRRVARGRVGAPVALVRVGRGRGGTVSPVFFGNRLIAAGRSLGAGRVAARPSDRVSRGWSAVELPDGRRGFLPAAALAGPRPPTLEARVASLLGSPYLWGGRTPAGYDCSAFVQQVLLERGVIVPRDAQEQCRGSRRLAGSAEPRPGDLVFFRRPREPASHVGLALGGGFFAHCRGRVLISSLEPSNPLCEKELLPQFMGWYRPVFDAR